MTTTEQLVGFFKPPAKGEEVPLAPQSSALIPNESSNPNRIGSGHGDVQQSQHQQQQQQQRQHEKHHRPLRYTSSGEVDNHYYDDEKGDANNNVTYKEIPRLIPRNLAFGQSKNVIRVSHNHRWRIFWLLRHDWFHAGLRFPTSVSFFLLLSIWTIMIVLFALLYVGIDNKDPLLECGLGLSGSPISFAGAFAFSLETCTTVGYTLPYGVNAFFDVNCPELIIAIYFQMIWSMMFNAFLFAFIYNRLGRSEARGTQVVMSSKAIVNINPGGQVRFQVRIFDVDASHPVVEAHVRLYVVNKNRPVPRPLRVLQPNDELGATLILSLPTVVTHHIDAYSILHPPSEQQPLHPCGLVLRQVDSYTNNREEHGCPICGEAYGTFDRWSRHVRYQQLVEGKENYPVQGSHLSLTEDDLLPPRAPTTDLHELRDYFARELSEVVCVVEGIDPLTSGTFQGLQSYKFDDILWEEHTQFAPCLTIDHKENFVVDLDKFHDTTRIVRPKSFRIINNNNKIKATASAAGSPPTNKNNINESGNGGGEDVPTSLHDNFNNNNNNNKQRLKQRSANVHDSLIHAIEAEFSKSGSIDGSL